MNELTKLPDKWCVNGISKTNKEDYLVLSNYFSKFLNPQGWHISTSIAYYFIQNGEVKREEKLPINYTVLTFDQFKKWVLKEESEFITGKWYDLQGNYYKYIRTEGKKGYHRESIRKGVHKYDVDWGHINNVKQDEIPLEKIQQWLPKGHPDLIVKPIEKWSVGSYGVLITNSNIYRYKKGYIDKIEKVVRSSEIWFENYKSYNPIDLNYQEKDEFKWFATLEEAEIFKMLIKNLDNFIENQI